MSLSASSRVMLLPAKSAPRTVFTSDAAKVSDHGYLCLLGRVDDVLNVSGHRIGTMEIESALVDHPSVAEAAVSGIADEISGAAIAAFVTLREGLQPSVDHQDTLKGHVVQKIGSIARPKAIVFTAELPKTRSGKIMRRLPRDVAEGRVLGDPTTLADDEVIAGLKAQYEQTEEEAAG